MLAEGEGAAVPRRTDKRAARVSVRTLIGKIACSRGWQTGRALTFGISRCSRDVNNARQAYGCLANEEACSRH